MAYGPRRANRSDINIEAVGKSHRYVRRPMHTFRLRIRPWQFVPTYICAVLAGETMKQGLLRSRVIGDAIKSGVTGWWLEHYTFYVRVGDLTGADTIRAAIVDPAQNMDALDAAASPGYFHTRTTKPSWIQQCQEPILRSYFRKEGEAWNAATLDGYPALGLAGSGWFNSLYPGSALPAESGADDFEKRYSVWAGIRAARLTVQTWEEFLAGEGVSTPPRLREDVADFRIPELVRFVREFTYPVATVDATTGLVAATVQWNTVARMDRSRFFAEPGFLCGFMVARPKVYMQNHRTSVADTLLDRADGWLPAVWDTDPHMAISKFVSASNDGPIEGASVDHWLDKRDLFLYGEQFMNIDLAAPPGSAGAWSLVALPATNIANTLYPSLADAQGLFVGGGSPAREYLQVDGAFSPHIATRLVGDITT